MSASEIRDRASLEAWLEGRPRRDAETIASRAALRVAPLYWAWCAAAQSSEHDLTELTISRALLISGVAAVRPTPDIRAAARAAASASSAVARAASAVARAATSSSPAYAASAAASSAASSAYAASSASATAASVTAASFAASSVAPSAANVAALWYEIRADAMYVEGSGEPLDWGLWTGAPPEWLPHPLPHKSWPDRGPGWQFWHDWYEGYINGHPFPIELLVKVALITDEVWRQGLLSVTAAIREIKGESGGGEMHVQAAVLLHAAIADYTFDAIDRVMRMVPFEDDIRHLRDPVQLAAFLNDAESLRDDIDLFTSALRAEAPATQGAGFISAYLDGVLSEFSRARQMGQLRVGRIVELGKILEDYAQDEHVAAEFGPAVGALRSHVNSLLDLTRRHFAATLTRMVPLRDISSSLDDDQWALLQDIQRGIVALADGVGSELHPLAKEDQAVLHSLADSVERLLRQYEVVPSPQAKSSLRREIDYRLVLLSVSIGLYLDEARVTELGPGKVLDSIRTQYKRASGVVGLWVLIKEAWNGLR